MPRSQDPRITEAVLDAAMALLAEGSFSGISMEAIAARAGVGKPALYRRFSGKADLVAAAIARVLPPMHAVEPGDVRRELRRLLERSVPEDPPGYAGLLGGLMAEHRRHPQLIRAFRERVLLPRRAVVRQAIETAQRRGVVRADLDAEIAVDLFGGPFLARVFAGLDIDARWRDELFERWWEMVRA